MRKKDTLYKANKWNKPLFMPDENLFPEGGWAKLANADKSANTWNYADDANTTRQYMESTNAFGISKADNPFSKGNLQGGLGAMAKTSFGGAVIGGLGAAVGGLANKAISGGYSSGAGNAIAGLGSTIGGAIGQVNPLFGAAVQVGSGIIGGGINALWGTKVDEQALKENKEGNSKLISFSSNAGSFDAIKGPQGVANVKDAYAGGVFKKGWAEEKNRELWNSREQAMLLAQRGVTNNVDNLESDQINNELANYSAFGGPLGAVELDLAYDALNVKRKNAQNKDKMTNLFMGTPSLFAFGGDMEGTSRNYSVGKIYDVTEEEANRLKSLGYEFTVVS